MPYRVFEMNGVYCVHKIADGGGKGDKIACHGSDKEKAEAQVRALYAQENQASFSNTILLNSTQARRVNQNGKDFLVVPGVPAREQVMNTYLVPAADLMRSLKGWNGVPITIQHPKLNDRSANVPDPDVAVIGRFYNAAWDADNSRMVGEYWIDVAEATKYVEGKSILNKINEGVALETSTGYYAEDEPTSGIFDGKTYKTIHRNLLPDHIAILTNEVGACSLKDGCGVNRNVAVNNCECDCPYKKSVQNNAVFPAFQEGHLPVKMLAGYAVNKGNRTPEQLEKLREYIKTNGVTEPVIVVRMNDSNLKILDGNHRIAISDEMGKEYVPAMVVDEGMRPLSLHAVYAEQLHKVDQSYLNQSRDAEPALITNRTRKESTMKYDEFKDLLLKKGLKVEVNGDDMTVEETQPDPEQTLSAEEIAALKALAGLAPKLNQQALDGIGKIPVLLEMAQNVENQQKAEKESLIAIMVANAANSLSKDELEAMPLPVLQKLHGMNNITYAPLGGAVRPLFGNDDVLVVNSTWDKVKPEADNG